MCYIACYGEMRLSVLSTSSTSFCFIADYQENAVYLSKSPFLKSYLSSPILWKLIIYKPILFKSKV